jgi:hypothetical protein
MSEIPYLRVVISKLYIFFLAVVLLISGYSCKKDNSTPDFKYDYFDLTPGRYITYDVTEISHDAGASIPHDTSKYQIKTVIGDTIIDNEGRVARKYLRYKRVNSSLPWTLNDIWTTIIVDRRAELIEENQRMIKMVFSPSIYKEWDLNAFNTQDPLLCYYGWIDEPYNLNGLQFDSTVRVEQDYEFNLVRFKSKHETYAKGVGLVWKYYKDLTIGGFDTLNVSNGDELYMKAIEFGFE